MRYKPYTNPKKILLSLGYEKNGARGYVRTTRKLKGGKTADRLHSFIELDGFINLHKDFYHNKKNPKNRIMKKFSKGVDNEILKIKRLDYKTLGYCKLFITKLKEFFNYESQNTNRTT